MNPLHPLPRRAAWAALCAAALTLAGCSPSGTDAATGAKLFAQCAGCHQVGPNARAGFAPQLNDLFGRRAGSTPDFRYSAAMKASGIVWNDTTLAAFLHAPDKLVPGTAMRFWGIGDVRQIAALLAYLRTFQSPSAGQPPAGQPPAGSAPGAPPR
ncbi:cytochrome c family protein [Massilia sp. 9096]|uniref:c-type cytochrome n=1 Tax=Massilia sp. 9096 TaxID=1500894 RepID=UPI00068991F1|nr:c-type cytochrome [Massilia sp. 9096]